MIVKVRLSRIWSRRWCSPRRLARGTTPCRPYLGAARTRRRREQAVFRGPQTEDGPTAHEGMPGVPRS